MIWNEVVKTPFAEITMWIGMLGAHQYVLTHNKTTDRWMLSAKTIFGPVDQVRLDLGNFETREEAEAACEKHSKEGLQ